MNEICEDKLIEELNNMQGLDSVKDTILQYAKYISLLKENKIKGIGNSNVLLYCNENYINRKVILNLLLKILGTDDVHYLTRKELSSDIQFKRINSKVLIFDTVELQTILRLNIADLVYRINQNPDKTFIVVDCGTTEDAVDCLGFNWIIKVEESSIKDKQKYIENKLKDNGITISNNCDYIPNLAKKDLPFIDGVLLNLVIDCITTNVDTVTDAVLEKYLQIDTNRTAPPNIKTALQQLDDLVGLDNVKGQIHQIVNYVKVNKQRGKMPMLNMVFEGSSGTGKTEVARLVAQIFKEEGVLSQGQLIEVSRGDLVAGYVGQTALKTQAIVNKALGGVLFIDEAYSLNPRESVKDYGHECISTIIKAMEDYRDDLCVILAGYTEDMKKLLKSNKGFSSRIQFKLQFNDYISNELYDIFMTMVTNDRYRIISNIRPLLINHFEKVKHKDDFGNGRYVRSLFEKIRFEQADRCANDTTADINIIKSTDIKNVLERIEAEVPQDKNKIGFEIGGVT